MTIFMRVRASDLFRPAQEVEPRVFEIDADHDLARDECAVGCGRLLQDDPCVLIPIGVHPEEHKFHGFGNAAAAVVHAECATPQPPEPWREFLAEAHRVVSIGMTQPGKLPSAVSAMLSALEGARPQPENSDSPLREQVQRAADYARSKSGTGPAGSIHLHTARMLEDELAHHADEDLSEPPLCDTWRHVVSITESLLQEQAREKAKALLDDEPQT